MWSATTNLWDPLSALEGFRAVQEQVVGKLVAARRATLASDLVGLGGRTMLSCAGVELARQTGAKLWVVDFGAGNVMRRAELEDCGVEFAVVTPAYLLSHDVGAMDVLVVSLEAFSPTGKTGKRLAELCAERECVLAGYHTFGQKQRQGLIELIEYPDGRNRVDLSQSVMMGL